jgi:beta-glucosidase
VQPAYAFGHGLSYTQFSFTNLKTSAPAMSGSLQVSVTVTNTGSVAGREVVQLYLGAPAGKLDKPSAELKAFGKTRLLQPGESQELSFTLTPSDLASFHTNSSAWIAEAGDYTVKIGTAQQAIASTSFKLPKEVVVEKVNKVLVLKQQINELKPIAAKTKK